MIYRDCKRIVALAVTAFMVACSSVYAVTEPSEQSPQTQMVSPDSREPQGASNEVAFESIYNQGVAQYREGEYAVARDLFTRTTAVADRALEAKARFNLANCDYAEAVALREESPDAAIEKLEMAISHYRGAIEANPQDADARANAELAQLLIDQIQQEQQDEQNQDEQNQDEQNQDEQNQDEQNQDEQNQDEQNQDQQSGEGEQEQNQDEQNQDQQSGEGEQEQNQEQQKQQPSAGQGENSSQQAEGYQSNGSTRDGQEPKAMTEEEAAKMLQAVRDRDLKRRYEKLRKTQRYYQPVDRDW